MGPDLRINWDDLGQNPDDFERLVKLLLRRLYPAGEVIDGRGGDGGREFQTRTPDSLVIYEAKSFTGRLSSRSPNRRAQVHRSLLAAAQHQPDAWNLVIPIDHNPEELGWFDGLRSDEFPFIEQWLGRTWLEEQMASHDDLLRYATKNQLLEYVRQYKLETEAAVGGVTDLLQRQAALTKLGDSISPHWQPILGALNDGTPSVTLSPKHPGAADEAPITLRMSVEIPVEPTTSRLRERLRESIDFGTGVEIPGRFVSEFTADGPPELGLPNRESTLDKVVLAAIPQTTGLPDQTVSVFAPRAAFPLASLDFRPTSATHGQGGVRLCSVDVSGALELVTLGGPDKSVTLKFQSRDVGPATPATLLPALRLLRVMAAPNVARLTLRKDGQSRDGGEFELGPIEDDGPPVEFIEYLEDLTAIQDALNQQFAISLSASRGDREIARKLRSLLSGEVVPWMHGPINVTIEPTRLRQFRREFPADGGLLRVSHDDLVVDVGGRSLHAGPMFMVGHVKIDLSVLPDNAADGEDVVAVLEVVGDGWFRAQRGRPEDEPDPPSLPIPPGRGRVSYSPVAPPSIEVSD